MEERLLQPEDEGAHADDEGHVERDRPGTLSGGLPLPNLSLLVMPRIAIVVLAGTDGPSDMGRAVNALETAAEAIGTGDDLRLIFDGAGTQWIAALADPEHRYHDLYAEVKPHVTGACQYCANAYGVKPAVVAEGIPLLKEHRGHPSLRGLVVDGFEVLTF